MKSIPGYFVQNPIHEGKHTAVFRAVRQADGLPVVIKGPNRHPPDKSQVLRLKKEFGLLSYLVSDAVVRVHDFIETSKSCAMVMENFGGVSLKRLLEQNLLSHDFSTYLDLALQITRAVDAIHRKNIIHKDINPSNMLYNPGTGEFKIIDFGISTDHSHETPAFVPPNRLEGTLAYMSPEQTGRMNRMVDYRSDFYSLGLALYELLYRKPPVDTQIPLELIHWHLANPLIFPAHPFSMDNFSESVRGLMNRIIQKLTEKDAENRYQSAAGIEADLLWLKKAVEKQNRMDSREVSAYEIGQKDAAGRLSFPQRLYGRERERQTLEAEFKRTRKKGTGLAMVAGYSGIGKTSLVKELQLGVFQSGGLFVNGKCDKLTQTEPFLVFSRALTEVIRQILTQSRERVHFWQTRLNAVLGNIGAAALTVVPELVRIIGFQPPVPDLPAETARVRLELALIRLISGLVRENHPMVIFLDDLQWVDPASLALLETLAADTEAKGLYLIGAYRDNEVSRDHPLLKTVERLETNKARVTRIPVPPLNLTQAGRMLAHTMGENPEAVLGLAALCLEKTGGNPFFLKQFLVSLVDDGLLTFDQKARKWKWSAGAIEQAGISDNMGRLLARRLEQLAPDVLSIVKTGACIGNVFDVKTVSAVCRFSYDEIIHGLNRALFHGFILPDAPKTWYAAEKEETRDVDVTRTIYMDTANPGFRFLHDQVRQTAYELMAHSERMDTHLAIGRFLLSEKGEDDTKESIFDPVVHLNTAREKIQEESEKIDLARLNLTAGIQARNAGAYDQGLELLKTGIELVGPDGWETHGDLMKHLQWETADLEMYAGLPGDSEKRLSQALEKAETDLDKAEVYFRMMLFNTRYAHYEKGLEMGIQSFRFLGIEFQTDNPGKGLEKEVARIEALLENRPIESILDLGEMKNPEHMKIMEIFTAFTFNFSWDNEKVLPYVAAWSVRFTMENGLSPNAPVAFASWGYMQCYSLRKYKEGYAFGKMAIKLARKYGHPYYLAIACHLFGSFTAPWNMPLKQTFPLLVESGDRGFEAGDAFYGLIGTIDKLTNMFLSGTGLQEVLEAYDAVYHKMAGLKAFILFPMVLAFRSAVVNLMGKTGHFESFDDHIFNETEFLAKCRQNPEWMKFGYAAFSFFKGRNFYLYQKPAEALQWIRESGEPFKDLAPVMVAVEHRQYLALILLALCPLAKPGDRKKYFSEMEDLLGDLKEWSRACPENFEGKYLMVLAEKHRVTQQPWAALNLYLKSAEAAEKNEFVQDEALAYELLGRLLMAENKPEITGVYLQKALDAYERWGAVRKVNLLKKEFGTLVLPPKAVPDTNETWTVADAVDFVSLLGAARSISQQIDLSRLLETAMEIALQNSGAQTGALLLNDETGWRIAARALPGGVRVFTENRPAMETDARIAAGVVRYGARILEPVVLENAVADNRFLQDPHIREHKVKSLMCVPLIRQNRLMGTIILENNAAESVFTPDRVKVLETLAAQMAISLENAEFAHDLEKMVAQRAAELVQKNKDLEKEIQHRQKVEARLQESHAHLELRVEQRTDQLKEANTALKVLLKQREADKSDLEQVVLHNVTEKVIPYLERIRNTRLSKTQGEYVTALEKHLNEIIAPISQRLSQILSSLSPMETKVAEQIRLGRSSKEIADRFAVSVRTVETHRNKIRQKLGLKHKKTNLQVYLSSME